MELISFFNKGGLVMYPLLICSFISVVILFERISTYGKARSNMAMLTAQVPELAKARNWKGLSELCQEVGGAPAEVIQRAAQQPGDHTQQVSAVAGAAESIAGRLRAYLNYLETIVTLAPLLGLLGTVTGMIGSFSVLSVSEGQPFAITGGVGEALIATASGLCVAILALVIHTYLSQQQDYLITDIEEVSSIYLTALAGGESHAA